MRTPRVWRMLSPAAISTSMQRLAVNSGFVDNPKGTRGFHIGVNASIWIHQLLERPSSCKQPELVVLFERCAQLLQIPIMPLFVFNGPRLPATKKMAASQLPEWLVTDFQELLDAFAFCWVEAAGDADAELAWMSKTGILGAVVTDDIDAFVFGAKSVIRTMKKNRLSKEVTSLYTLDDIAAHPALELNQCDFLLVALLIGGGYSDGLPYCKVDTAIALAHAGLGALLMEELDQGGDLSAWRLELINELETNHSQLGLLPASIPPGFPDRAEVDHYLHPITSEHLEPPLVPNPVPSRGLDLPQLVKFAEENYIWAGSDASYMYRYFSTTIFPGLAMRQLLQSACVADLGLSHRPCPMIGSIVSLRRESTSSAPRAPELRLNLNIDASTKSSIFDQRRGGEVVDLTNLPFSQAWLPLTVVEWVQPELLVEFLHRKGGVRGVEQAIQDVAEAYPINLASSSGSASGMDDDNTEIDQSADAGFDSEEENGHEMVIEGGDNSQVKIEDVLA
ncbi:hypothetical protein DXG01_001555 [Tephrocybe rancida]|nr:hypothetical protein DXG01_001555 [Tephrocybe rancida]